MKKEKMSRGFPSLEELALFASIPVLRSNVNTAKDALKTKKRKLEEAQEKFKKLKSARLPNLLWCAFCMYQVVAEPCKKCKKNVCDSCHDYDEDSDGYPTRYCPYCIKW
jgi:hypothetical protein